MLKRESLYFQIKTLTPTNLTVFISNVLIILLVVSYLKILKASENFVQYFLREKV